MSSLEFLAAHDSASVPPSLEPVAPDTELLDKGLARQKAYEMVQRNAMTAWRERTAFRDLLAADPEVMAHLTRPELDGCFDPEWYLRNVAAIYRRIGLPA